MNISTIFLYFVVVASYFMIIAHKYFFEIHGGLIRTWFPTALLLFVLAIKHFMAAKSYNPSIKVDEIYSVKIILLLYSVFWLIALNAHGEGIHYIAKYSLQLYSPVVLSMLIVMLVKSNLVLERIMALLFFVGVIWAISIEYGYFFGSEGSVMDEVTFSSGEAADLTIRHGSFGFGVNTYAAMLIPLPLVGLYLKERAKNFIKKIFYYILSIFLIAAIFMTISRAAILSILIGIFTLLWYKFIYSPKKFKHIITLFLIFITLFTVIISNVEIIPRFLMMFAQFDILANSEYIQDKIFTYGLRVQREERFEIISDSLSHVAENPIFGVGFNKIFNETEDVYEHNYYVRLIAANGIMCFISFIAFLISLTVITRKAVLKNLSRNTTEKEMGILLFAGLLAFIFYLNAAPSEFYFYWIWFGLTAAWVRNSAHKDRNEVIAY